jgi:hypothetical protein
MKALELKAELISKINDINDAGIIEEIKMLLDFELEEKVFELNDKQKSHIRKAKLEYLNSEILDEKAADGEIDKWLGEK